ncbi:hypothetical protein M407DRAFT_26312 [Tulasnella calospora MUT 4182]|uniref:DUF6535 domain-containing protein n=1 Tax=Tulasnella calospora MUT 4182 TaxID=1051891 RepID=A0A0C3Q5A3_9AGAM|nr:hypothetical protein M407DRAFT_26312 [Tulasnella calospora MUT 4182]
MNARFEEKLTAVPETPNHFGEDGGHFYRYYDALADEIDEDMVMSLKAQLDGILIFAGLFAGVNSAFLALTLPELSADPVDDTNALLLQLVTGGNGSIASGDIAVMLLEEAYILSEIVPLYTPECSSSTAKAALDVLQRIIRRKDHYSVLGITRSQASAYCIDILVRIFTQSRTRGAWWLLRLVDSHSGELIDGLNLAECDDFLVDPADERVAWLTASRLDNAAIGYEHLYGELMGSFAQLESALQAAHGISDVPMNPADPSPTIASNRKIVQKISRSAKKTAKMKRLLSSVSVMGRNPMEVHELAPSKISGWFLSVVVFNRDNRIQFASKWPCV